MPGKYEIEIDGIDAVFDIEVDDDAKLDPTIAELARKYRGKTAGQISQALWAEAGLAPGGRGTFDMPATDKRDAEKLQTEPTGLEKAASALVGFGQRTGLTDAAKGATRALASTSPIGQFIPQSATRLVDKFLPGMGQAVREGQMDRGEKVDNVLQAIKGGQLGKAAAAFAGGVSESVASPLNAFLAEPVNSQIRAAREGIASVAAGVPAGTQANLDAARFARPQGQPQGWQDTQTAPLEPLSAPLVENKKKIVDALETFTKHAAPLLSNVPNTGPLMATIGPAIKIVQDGGPEAAAKMGEAGYIAAKTLARMTEMLALDPTNVAMGLGVMGKAPGIAKAAHGYFTAEGAASIKHAYDAIKEAKTSDEIAEGLALAGMGTLMLYPAGKKGAKDLRDVLTMDEVVSGRKEKKQWSGTTIEATTDPFAKGANEAMTPPPSPNKSAAPPPDGGFPEGTYSGFQNPLEGVVGVLESTGRAVQHTQGQDIPLPTTREADVLSSQVENILRQRPGATATKLDDYTFRITEPDGNVWDFKGYAHEPVDTAALWAANPREAAAFVNEKSGGKVQVDPAADYETVRGALDSAYAGVTAAGYAQASRGVAGTQTKAKHAHEKIKAKVDEFIAGRKTHNESLPEKQRVSDAAIEKEAADYRRQLYDETGSVASSASTGAHEGLHMLWGRIKDDAAEWFGRFRQDVRPEHYEERTAEVVELMNELESPQGKRVDDFSPKFFEKNRGKTIGEVFPNARTMFNGEYADLPLSALDLPRAVMAGAYGPKGEAVAPGKLELTPEQRRAAAADTAARMRPPEARPPAEAAPAEPRYVEHARGKWGEVVGESSDGKMLDVRTADGKTVMVPSGKLFDPIKGDRVEWKDSKTGARMTGTVLQVGEKTHLAVEIDGGGRRLLLKKEATRIPPERTPQAPVEAPPAAPRPETAAPVVRPAEAPPAPPEQPPAQPVAEAPQTPPAESRPLETIAQKITQPNRDARRKELQDAMTETPSGPSSLARFKAKQVAAIVSPVGKAPRIPGTRFIQIGDEIITFWPGQPSERNPNVTNRDLLRKPGGVEAATRQRARDPFTEDENAVIEEMLDENASVEDIKTQVDRMRRIGPEGKRFSVRNTDPVVEAVRESLTDDLLKPEYRAKARKTHTEGHCYVAAEAAFHLLGGKAAGLKSWSGRDSDGGTHWWLTDDEGKIIDPTKDQYHAYGEEPPYENGRPVGFLTKDPSKRAQEVIRRVGNPDTRYSTRQVETPEFKDWFGDWEKDPANASKVVDEAGRPLVVYHGTAYEISEFKHLGPTYKNDSGWLGRGFYGISSPEVASGYATRKKQQNYESMVYGRPNVMPLYFDIKNPYYATMADKRGLAEIDTRFGREEGGRDAEAFTKRLRENGHDGVILRIPADEPSNKTGREVIEVVAFSPTQIKSATGNRGTFDPTNPDIRYSMAGERARHIDKTVLDEAKARVARGENPETVRRETGWGQGRDKRWRFEIDDSRMAWKRDWNALRPGQETTLGELIDHPESFAAYPELANIKVEKRGGWVGTQGWFDDTQNKIYVSPSAVDPLNTILHEMTHYVQLEEGFAKGGSPENVWDFIPAEEKPLIAADVAAKLAQKAERSETAIKSYVWAEKVWSENTELIDRFKDLYRAAKTFTSKDPSYAELRQLGKEVRALLDNDPSPERVGAAMINSTHSRSELTDARMRERERRDVALEDAKELLTTQNDGDIRDLVEHHGDLYDFYRRLAGEVEARNVQKRKDMTPEQRAETSWDETADVPPGQEIMRFSTRKIAPEALRDVEQMVKDADKFKDWKNWYLVHKKTIDDLFEEDAPLFRKILAVTSQRASVGANVTLAIKAYEQMKTGQPFTGFQAGVVANLGRIQKGEELSGRKVTNYDQAGSHKAGASKGVAVDRHVARYLFGVDAPTPAQYDMAERMITDAAERLGWKPRQVQAALWAFKITADAEAKGKKASIKSYADYLNKKADYIKAFRTRFAQDAKGEGGGVPLGGRVVGGDAQVAAPRGEAEGIAYSTRNLDPYFKKMNEGAPWVNKATPNFRGKPGPAAGYRKDGTPIPPRYVIANEGKSPTERALIDEVIKQRFAERLPNKVTDVEAWAEWRAEKRRDPAAAAERIVRLASTRPRDMTLADQAGIMDMMREYAEKAERGDKDAALRVQLLKSARMSGKTEFARGLRFGGDPNRTPAQRLQDWFREALFEPMDSRTARGIEKGDPKAIEAQRKHMEKLLADLRKEGMDTSTWTEEQAKDPYFVADRIRWLFSEKKATAADKVYEFWRNSILSGPLTNVVNLTSNTAMFAYEYGFLRPIQAALGGVIRGDKVEWESLKAAYAALLSGVALREGMSNAGRAWKTEASVLEQKTRGGLAFEGGGKDYPKVAIAGLKGRIIRAPERGLKTMDEFQKGVIGQMEAAASAYKIATREGLKGKELGKRMADLISDYTSDAWDKAVDHAELLTFQKKMGQIGQLVMKGRDIKFWGTNVKPFAYVLPFVTTPANIFKTGIESTPLGAVSTGMKLYEAAASEGGGLRGVKDAITKGTKEGDAALRGLTQTSIAIGATYLLGSMLMNDDPEKGWVITGPIQYKIDPRGEREAKYRSLPPSSFVRKVGGKTYAINYGRIESLATTVGLMADGAAMMRAFKVEGANQALTEGFERLIGQFRDKTFLKTIGDLMGSLEDPSRVQRILSTFASSWVPNIIRQPLRSLDPKVREARVWGTDSRDDIGESKFMRSVRRTGYSALPADPFAPPAKRDMIGREITKLGQFPLSPIMRLISPVQFGALEDTTPAALIRFDHKMMRRQNEFGTKRAYFPRQPDPYYSVKQDDGTVRKISLSDEQRSKLERLAGEYLWERMQDAEYFTKTGKLENEDVEEFKKDVKWAKRVARKELWDDELTEDLE